MSSNPSPNPSWFARIVTEYQKDHSHPVNHFMHVFIGWPMVGAALILLPLGYWPWSIGLFLGGYAVMFTGHFVVERNVPTVLKHPSTPFIIAWDVVRNLGRGVARLAGVR